MSLEHPELIEADDPAVALLGLDEGSCRPLQGHRAVLPVRHPAGPLPHTRVCAVDDVGRAQALPQSRMLGEGEWALSDLRRRTKNRYFNRPLG